MLRSAILKNSAYLVRRFLWIASLFLLAFSHPFAVNAERLPVKTYTVADGLQRDFVVRIRQDSRGFMWFCTAEGISRFDGTAMISFTNADGLPDLVVEDFLETRDGTIYVATHKGLARLNPNGLRGSGENPLFTVILPENPKAEKIQVLYEDDKNQVWVGTSDGLYRLIVADGNARLEPTELGKPLDSSGGAVAEPAPATLGVSAILGDRNGNLWVGTFGSGLFRISKEAKVRRFTTADGFGDNKVTDLLETRSGRLWMSMRSDESGGICELDAEDEVHPIEKCYSEKDGLGSNWVRDMLETSDGQMWLATIPGLCRWQNDGGPVCKTFSAKNELCDRVSALSEDKDGNLWTGSHCGAQKISRYGFTTFNAADGLNNDQITSVFENSRGELFAVAFPETERTVSRFDGDSFSLAKPRLPESVTYHGWGWRQTVWQDSRGAWWIPSGVGLFRSPDNTGFDELARVRLELVQTGAKGLEAFRLFEDSRGDIWISTTGDANELFRWERAKNVWHEHTSEVGFSLLRVGSAFAEDASGNVWIGATSDHGESALIRYKNGEFRVLTQAEGAPGGWIRDLFLDSRKRLWIASTDDGAWRLDNPDSDTFDFAKYTPANGLTSVSTASVTEDVFGRIYIGTWRGVDRLVPDTGQVENLTTDDGLPAGFVETAFRDRDNYLWFGTERGLARFRPEPTRERIPPTVLITGLSVGGVPQRVSILGESALGNLDLRSDQRQITLDFIGLGASLGEKLKYEYRFGDSNWNSTNERRLDFASLAPGDYQLEVRAQTIDRVFSRPASVSFRIPAPLWQRWWFLLLAAALAGCVVYVVYKSRLRRFVELERVRTRIATDLHDDIGANLTRISLLSEVARHNPVDGSGKLLSSIADIARESVASMNDIVWAIAPEHDSLLDLTRRMRAFAEEVFALRDVELDFNAPPSETDLKLSVGARRDLLLIFKEAVNNVAKHSGCTEVSINLAVNKSVLILRIEDNGKGIGSGLQSEGQGLRSMSRRAAALGGSLNIESPEGAGTTVRFEVNLQRTGQA